MSSEKSRWTFWITNLKVSVFVTCFGKSCQQQAGIITIAPSSPTCMMPLCQCDLHIVVTLALFKHIYSNKVIDLRNQMQQLLTWKINIMKLTQKLSKFHTLMQKDNIFQIFKHSCLQSSCDDWEFEVVVRGLIYCVPMPPSDLI